MGNYLPSKGETSAATCHSKNKNKNRFCLIAVVVYAGFEAIWNVIMKCFNFCMLGKKKSEHMKEMQISDWD